MVHALDETHRILRPNGILVDLRPAMRHRRVGVGEGSEVRWLGWTHETFDEDRAANRAVAEVLQRRLFRRTSLIHFDLDRVMESVEDFETWLADFGADAEAPLHARLVAKLKIALREEGEDRITIRGPLRLAVLKKLAD